MKEIPKHVPSERKEKVAIVGGGFGGIGCISMLKEEGFEPVCFEKTDRIGGTWCYREASEIGITSIMPTTIINHSKEMGAFSNFPPKKEYSNYMRHSELYQYMQDYMEANDVEKHIRTHSEVTSIQKSEDYDLSGRWNITVRNTRTQEVIEDTYDRVIVAVGQLNYPNYPNYPGQSDFKGQMMHTHSLKSVESFKDKNVLIIGMGCSALDAAVEISRVAKQVYLSTRSGANVINRVGPYGYPIDYVLLRRSLFSFMSILPVSFCSWIIRKFFLDPKFDHKLYPVRPNHHLFAHDPSVNDHIGSRLLSGAVKQVPDVVQFTENGVFCQGDDDEIPIDAVIMATGYGWKFPFLGEGILHEDKESGRIDLYKCMWPVHLKYPTLAIIGFILPFGPGFPPGEMQIRYAAHVFAGKAQLPPEDKMLREVKKRHQKNVSRFKSGGKMTVRVDNVPYMDEIARKMGCKPNFLKMFFTDPKLYFKLVYGPFVSYQYRLKGPHPWEGAREAIFTVGERLHYPLRTKK